MGRVRRGLRPQRAAAKKTARAGLAYVGIIPCDYRVRLPSGTTIRADQAVAEAVFERRSCGNGSKGPRSSDWAMTATATPGQYLLIRRLTSRPDSHTFYLCWAPPDRPASMTYFITIAGRRWPVEETFKTGKDVFGWDQTQARTWNGTCRHTALAALAQLRAAAIRNAITGGIALPAVNEPPVSTRRTPAPRPATAPSMARSVTPTCRSPSARPPSRPAVAGPPTRHQPDQAVHRRSHPAGHPRRALHHRADHPRPTRLRAALVTTATTPPGHRPLAPLQRPAHRRQPETG